MLALIKVLFGDFVSAKGVPRRFSKTFADAEKASAAITATSFSLDDIFLIL